MKKLAAGNWKMNGSLNSLSEIQTLVFPRAVRGLSSLMWR